MICTGLLSVTFRQLEPSDILQLVVDAGLEAVEWGGDIHVPHGDIARAEEVRRLSLAAGVKIASYGSYYRLGGSGRKSGEFDKVLASALALRAPSIRVWAGEMGSAEANEEYRSEVVSDTIRICDTAAREGLTIDFEYHGGTLTDTIYSTLSLLKEVERPNLRCNWQPSVTESVLEREESLRIIIPWLANIHVFQWESRERLPLIIGKHQWERYLGTVNLTGKTHFAMLEFVQNDDQDQFKKDAKVLIDIVSTPTL